MYIVTISEKRGLRFEGNWRRVFGRILREEREWTNVVIIIIKEFSWGLERWFRG